MKPLVIGIVLLAMGPSQSQQNFSQVKESSYDDRSVGRVIRFETTVNAEFSQVWRAFSTAEGLKTFAAPVIEFELRSGGKAHSNMDPKARLTDDSTIRNEVLSFIPLRMLAIRLKFPASMPQGVREATDVFVVYEIEPVSARRSRVTMSTIGVKTGADWDTFASFWRECSAQTLEALRVRFASGPLDWSKATPYSGHVHR
jgi:uncharacterized protein YndB with AHSA1/START domain